MLTLCKLAGPVSIRQPQSPHLKSFRFFTSRANQRDGGERVHLHMGYFKTLTDAEKCLGMVRRRFPDAFVTAAPTGPFAPLTDESLTDTQVLKLLETRGGASLQGEAGEKKADAIELLRPDDTETRRALRDAVIQGAPVSFAVQLLWSEHSIDVSRVPSLEIFTGYVLYATESHRAGRCSHFLRLGFFGSPGTAKEVASQVRSHFGSAAVVPVPDDEVTRVRGAGANTGLIPYLLQQRPHQVPDSNGTPTPPAGSKQVRDRASHAAKSGETLEQTLRRLARGERWNDPDALSESGVRHLKIEVDRPDSRQQRHRIENITHRMKRLVTGQQRTHRGH
jgi:hypothetical protein